MRDRLVLADGPVEDDALLGVLHRTAERRTADADRLDARHHTLRIKGVQNVIEAAADLADHVVLRDLEAVDEDLVAVDGGAAELLDLLHGDLRAVELGEEQREVLERLLRIAL